MKTGLPYYIDHLIVALLLSAAGGLLWFPHGELAGPAFYTVREMYQWRQKGYFDWKGFLWPVVPIVPVWAAEAFLV